MKILNGLFLSLFMFAFPFSHAQYDPSRVHKKAQEAYNRAFEQAEAGDYQGSIKLLQAAIQKDKTYIDAYLSLAGVYGQLKNYPESIAWYEKAFEMDPNYTSSYRLPYTINLAGIGQFEKALEVITTLLARQDLSNSTRKADEFRQKTYQFAVDYAKNNQEKNYVFTPVNLDEGVKPKESE